MEGNQLCCYLNPDFHCRVCDRVWCGTCCDSIMAKGSHAWDRDGSYTNLCSTGKKVRIAKYRPGGYFEAV